MNTAITRSNSVYTLRQINEAIFKYENNERRTFDSVIGVYTDGIQALTTALKITEAQREADALDALEYGTCFEVIRALEPMTVFNIPFMNCDVMTLQDVKYSDERFEGRYKLIISKTTLNQ